MTNLPFDFDTPASYMSIEDFVVPPHLEARARAALAELEDIKHEFDSYVAEHEFAVSQREDKFDDAMSHFQESKDDWVRTVDEHGNVEWVYIADLEIDVPSWLADLEAKDTLDWGEV